MSLRRHGNRLHSDGSFLLSLFIDYLTWVVTIIYVTKPMKVVYHNYTS